jgi:predicted membrane GTPase involved in stress response
VVYLTESHERSEVEQAEAGEIVAVSGWPR